MKEKKTGSETGVESDLAFCLGSLFKKTNSEVAKNWFPVRFWPKVHSGVWGVFPKKNWAGLMGKSTNQLRLFIPKKFPDFPLILNALFDNTIV